MWSAGQTHLSPNYPLLIDRTASYTISTYSYTSKSHIRLYKLVQISQYHISPEYTCKSVHYNKAGLSHTTNKSTLFENNRPTLDSTCHRKRPPPVTWQSPTTTTCGRWATPDHCLLSVSRNIYNSFPHNNIRSTYTNSSGRYTNTGSAILIACLPIALISFDFTNSSQFWSYLYD